MFTRVSAPVPVFAAFGSYFFLSKTFTFPRTLRRAEHQNLANSNYIIAEDNANAEELELNFGTKTPVDKCQREIKYLLDKYKDAKLTVESKPKWRSY